MTYAQLPAATLADTPGGMLTNLEDAGSLYRAVIDDVVENVQRQFESYGWDPAEIQRKLLKFRRLWEEELDMSGSISKVNETGRKATIPAHLTAPLRDQATITQSNNAQLAAKKQMAVLQQTGKRKEAGAGMSFPQYQQQANARTNIALATYQLANTVGLDIPPNPYETLPPIPQHLASPVQPPAASDAAASSSSSSAATASSPAPNGTATPVPPSDQNGLNGHAPAAAPTTPNQASLSPAPTTPNQQQQQQPAASPTTPTQLNESNTLLLADDPNALPPFVDPNAVSRPVDLDSEILGAADDDIDDAEEPTENLILCTYDKVTHKKDKWRAQLSYGIMVLNGKDYIFSKCLAELTWS